MKYICVFCGSSDRAAEKYKTITQRLGKLIVDNGYGLVCGGGNAGLMKVIIDAVLAARGKVIGVITPEIREAGVEHMDVSEMLEEANLGSRKQKMMDIADAFITLPGGLGTLDEMMEVAIANQFQNFAAKKVKPLTVLNADNFFEGSILQLDRAQREGFMTRAHHDMIFFHSQPEAILAHIVNYQEPDPNQTQWWKKDDTAEPQSSALLKMRSS